jgi:hypothetical protein
MSSLRDEAEALAYALEMSAVDVGEVIDWADAQIAAQAAPHWSLCEAATSRRKHPLDLASELRQVPGPSDPASVRSLLTQLIARKLRADASRAHQLASALFQMALDEEISDPELLELAWWAWDALDIADTGAISQTRSEIVERMLTVLERAAKDAARCGPRWGPMPTAV